MTAPDVIVAGGGVIGCSIAWRLAERSAKVTVVDPGVPGSGATWASAGMLSPLGEAAELDEETGRRSAFRALAAASLDRWPAFADAVRDESGQDVGYRKDGKLHIALDDAGLRALDALAAGGEGFVVARLNPAEARSLEPALSPRIRGALLVRRDHSVDTRKLGEAIARAAMYAGAKIRRDRVIAVRAGAGGARRQGVRVKLEDGTVLAAAVVIIAAGAWSATIAGLPSAVPVRPRRGQMFAVRRDLPNGAPTHTIESPDCYIVPRGRLLLAGATVEDVGWAPGPTPAGIVAVARAAIEAVPAIADAPIVESWAGFRPGTPDDLPILGPDPAAGGIVHATGHFRNGILLAPITADVIAASVLGEPTPIDIAPFGIDRFREREP